MKNYNQLTINEKINTKGNNQFAKGAHNKTLIGAANKWIKLTRFDFSALNYNWNE